MRCDTCQGHGYVRPRFDKSRFTPSAGYAPNARPCPDCDGAAVAHCCEGDQAQPGVTVQLDSETA